MQRGEIRGSLWLRPTGPVLERLQELIRRLTARFPGTWPRPHVSLLGGIELSSDGTEEKLAEMAARLRPIPVRLGRLEGRDEHFRCFYAVADPVPELMEAHEVAKEIFGMRTAEPYRPHLSLLYGRIDAPAKARLAKDLGGHVNLSFIAGSIHLVNASAALPVSAWQTLHEVPLRRPRRDRAASARSVNL